MRHLTPTSIRSLTLWVRVFAAVAVLSTLSLVAEIALGHWTNAFDTAGRACGEWFLAGAFAEVRHLRGNSRPRPTYGDVHVTITGDASQFESQMRRAHAATRGLER